ncbi:MAG: CPBP family intramembrane metalloprotease [Bacteroidales bacterium]|jgi:membrane protease YdiL (CAAX protease family)|nr:CPBP family intramembrane metalloprotease [Bacteroidales bacterium]
MIAFNLKSFANQIALFLILFGINTVFFSLFTGFTASFIFGIDNLTSAEALRYIESVSQIVVFGLTGFAFAFFVNEKKPLHYLGLNKGISWISCFFLVMIFVISLPALSWIIEWNEGIKLPQFMSSIEQWMREQEDAATKQTSLLLSGNHLSILFVNLLVMAIIPAVCEELLFRGAIITWFKNLLGNVHLSVCLSAVIFSAIHLQFYGFVPRLLLGLYLGYVFVWTGSIWASIIAHFINNGILVIVSWLYNVRLINSQYDDFDVVGDNYLLIALSFILTSVCIYLFYRIFNHKEYSD